MSFSSPFSLPAARLRIAALTEVGLKASEVSFRGLDRLVRQGLDSARGALTDGAERLRVTARSESLAELYDAQRATLPASQARIIKELVAVWAIMLSTGQELAEVARTAREELSSGAPKYGRARARKLRSRRPGQRDRSRRATPPGL